MPRLLVDLLFFTGKQGGTETVARELYSRFAGARGWEFVGFASSELYAKGADWFPGRLIDSGRQSTNRPQWALGELTGVPQAARVENADLVHSPANFGPRSSPVPLVLTLHDMLAHRRPEFLPSRLGAIPTRLLISGAARAATHIITDSYSAKADIIDILSIDDARISVIQPGSAGRSQPAERTERTPGTLFSLGNRMKHKNFPRLIEALALIPAEQRPHLTVSGSHGDDPLRPLVERLGLERWVDLRSWLDQSEVERLYRESAAVVFPTMFEGFGLPVLEAMERGCPVICSDIPVLREVGGDAVRYFDPLSVEDMAATITRTLHDPLDLASMTAAGSEQAKLFSWDKAAEEYLGVFEAAAAASKR